MPGSQTDQQQQLILLIYAKIVGLKHSSCLCNLIIIQRILPEPSLDFISIERITK
jgi:hypothetical protein